MGFTSHEHINSFNLINMNGRMYDPVVGSFLSPDIVIQSPENSQNYNKYSYCLNNPLKYSDPSGYAWIEEVTITAPAPRVYNKEFPYSNLMDDISSYTDDDPGTIARNKYWNDWRREEQRRHDEAIAYRDAVAKRNQAHLEKIKSLEGAMRSNANSKMGASSAENKTQPLISNSDAYWGITGTSWLWGVTSTLTAPINSPAIELAGKVGVGLNWVATAAEGYDLYNNWDEAGTGDIAKFGVDATITVVTTILYISGVGAPVAVILTGVQVANTLGAFDSVYESFNEPVNGEWYGTW